MLPEYKRNLTGISKTYKKQCKVCLKLRWDGEFASKTNIKCNRCREEKALSLALQKYNLTIQKYLVLFHQQDGRCAICELKQINLKRRLVVDHNHKTGEVRGLLCARCNTIVGSLETKNIQKAVDYIKRHNKKQQTRMPNA